MKSGSPLILRVSLRLCLVLLIGLCLALSVQTRTAHAQGPQTLTVSPCDESDLDAAISQANTDNDGDTIIFNCNGGSSDITLTGTLFITGSMTLDGSGQNVTLDGNSSVQVLRVLTSGVSLTLNALTIANGYGSIFTGPGNVQGGGLYNNGGTVTITNSTFSNNQVTAAGGGCGCPIEGGGLYNLKGTVTISNSTFSNNITFTDGLFDEQVYGGGLANERGTVTISNSTFSGNEVLNTGSGFAEGGGLYNLFGSVTISNSTVSDSFTDEDGSGLFNDGTVTISNSTFANNQLATITGQGFGLGGGLFNGGTATISNSTFTGNSAHNGGGGLYNSGTIALSGSIVANNTSNNCAGGTITSTGYNLESGTDCGFTGTGDLQSTDPQLDPNGLQNNGGPTQTIALLESSPAIDHIPAANCPATDQRGMTRPDDNEPTCDTGAYESNYAPDTDLALTNMPTNMTVNATSPQGAAVTYASPTVVDEDSPLPTANCSPASGSTFAIGTTTVTCTVSDSDDANSPVSAGFSVTVTPVLTASGTSVSATEGHSLSGVVATGTAYVNGTPSASVDWGDGHTSAGSVTLNPDGSYSVTGSHTYTEEGSFAITVMVSASGVSNATANSSATVSDAALSANTPTAVIGKKGNVTLSTVFSDADPGGTASDYSATINWGDGSTPTSGTISASGTSFTATGSHTYAKHKTYTVTVTIKDAGGSSVTKTLTIKV